MKVFDDALVNDVLLHWSFLVLVLDSDWTGNDSLAFQFVVCAKCLILALPVAGDAFYWRNV